MIDDSVLDKRHSQVIELVKHQYSGNVHGLVRGIGIFNWVHSHKKDHYPIDFRVYAPEVDGKTKKRTFQGYGIEWVVTHRVPGSINTSVVQNENQRRWAIEQLHRELK